MFKVIADDACYHDHKWLILNALSSGKSTALRIAICNSAVFPRYFTHAQQGLPYSKHTSLWLGLWSTDDLLEMLGEFTRNVLAKLVSYYIVCLL